VSARHVAAVLTVAILGVLALPGSASSAPPDPPPAPTCSPGPSDCTRWHTTDTTVSWAPPPPNVTGTSGCNTVTITADTAATAVTCTWYVGLEFRTTGSYVSRDATPPSVVAKPNRGPDANGWYNRALTVEFSGGDALSGLASCSAPRAYAGPDSALAGVSGTCTDVAGNTASASIGFQYDATPPSVQAKPDRQPNHRGWYNRRVRVAFVGTDATSGVNFCAPDVTYDGPDTKQTAISGTCTDKAANTSVAAAFALKFDAKPPVLGRVRAEVRRKGAVLRWAASDDAEAFVVVRRPGRNGSRSSTVYTGPDHKFVDDRLKRGVKYRYTVAAYDEAGNAAVKGLSLRADVTTKPSTTRGAPATRPALTTPLDGARVSAPPLLDWSPVPRATYYNVQLFRNGKKVLTAWPKSTSFRLARTWKFEGRTQTLSPGRYRWYVWPGFGARSEADYGKPVGTRTFFVTRG
jgi:hypothetical protein